jgi:hypothetical protein
MLLIVVALLYIQPMLADSTKWYEIPAGEGAFGQQIYYYKNFATGAYLKGSTRAPGEGGIGQLVPQQLQLLMMAVLCFNGQKWIPIGAMGLG